MRITRQKKRENRGGLKVRVITLALLAASVPLYAQIVPAGLTSMADEIQEAFTGDLARVILGCCFAGSCIAYGYNKDNEKMKGKLLAVVIATGLLVLSQTIIKQVWEAV
jgi:type IV secretory pathway VirB2 component (pilin)